MPSSRDNANKLQKMGRMMAPSVKTVKKPLRAKPGQVAVRMIRRYQMSTELLIPKIPFQRLVREIAQDADRSIVPDLLKELAIAQDEKYEPIKRWSGAAMEALQRASEVYVINFLEAANDNAVHRNGETICMKDMHLARKHEKRFAVDPNPSYGEFFGF